MIRAEDDPANRALCLIGLAWQRIPRRRTPASR
jgi:hypothetical protein